MTKALPSLGISLRGAISIDSRAGPANRNTARSVMNRTLFVLEDEGDQLVVRPYDADHHGAIRGKVVAFESNRARFAGCTRP